MVPSDSGLTESQTTAVKSLLAEFQELFVDDVDPVADTDEVEPAAPRLRRKTQRPARLDDYVVGGVESAES